MFQNWWNDENLTPNQQCWNEQETVNQYFAIIDYIFYLRVKHKLSVKGHKILKFNRVICV